MMRKDVNKVSDSDYKLLLQIRNLKEKGITEEDIMQLDRNREISEKAKNKVRQDTIKLNLGRITHNQRAIQHKQNQIANDESLEKEESYLDGKKPFFMLRNEIEILTIQNEALADQNKELEDVKDKETKN